MIVVLLGPPGSGKGTQAKKLVADRHWPQLSTGDMFRSAIANGTRLGLEAKGYMDRGALVPDSVVIGLIEERIKQADCKVGFILDGFPRTIPQAEALDSMLTKAGREVGRAVLFKIPDPVLVQRLSGRRICPKDGLMYHIQTMRPKKDGICDDCGSELIHRDDDRPEVISKRLEVYHVQTEPVASYYLNRGKLHHLDATQSPPDVSTALNQALK
jgi:adenylate kinase